MDEDEQHEDNDDDLTGFAIAGYEIDCPACGYSFFEEGDVRGDKVTCPDCGAKFTVYGLGG